MCTGEKYLLENSLEQIKRLSKKSQIFKKGLFLVCVFWKCKQIRIFAPKMRFRDTLADSALIGNWQFRVLNVKRTRLRVGGSPNEPE
jgi:hypothetical protein